MQKSTIELQKLSEAQMPHYCKTPVIGSTVFLGDCVELMKQYKDGHFDLAVFNNEISSKKKKIEEIETLLNELHNDMAKSIIEMKTYKPLSTDLLAIKDKIRILND